MLGDRLERELGILQLCGIVVNAQLESGDRMKRRSYRVFLHHNLSVKVNFVLLLLPPVPVCPLSFSAVEILLSLVVPPSCSPLCALLFSLCLFDDLLYQHFWFERNIYIYVHTFYILFYTYLISNTGKACKNITDKTFILPTC